jgi:hypothetical protein
MRHGEEVSMDLWTLLLGLLTSTDSTDPVTDTSTDPALDRNKLPTGG